MGLPIEFDREKLAEFCRRNHIRKLSLFGSVLHDDFGPESDVDMLVEYEPGAKITFIDMGSQEIALAEMVGRKVDLRTPQELSRFFRAEVVEGAVVQYAE